MISFRSTTKCSLAAGSIVGLLATMICPLAEAFTLFETAALGPTGIADAGFEITNAQSVGARFEVTSPVTTSRVGAHLIDSAFPYVGNKQVYAAIIALSGPTDLPDSTILITPDVVGAALLPLPESSAEVSAPLSLSLQPGWYALQIGSWQFGASGWGVLTRNNIDIGRPDYYTRRDDQYSDTGMSDARLFVEAIPEPSAILLLVTGVADYPFLAQHRRPRPACTVLRER